MSVREQVNNTMSHPYPEHEYGDVNRYDGHISPLKSFKKEMKKVRSGLQKAVGHKRRERHSSAKNKALKKKMN